MLQWRCATRGPKVRSATCTTKAACQRPRSAPMTGRELRTKKDNAQMLIDLSRMASFEHHVAANFSSVAPIVHEATTRYLNWEMYSHHGSEPCMTAWLWLPAIKCSDSCCRESAA